MISHHTKTTGDLGVLKAQLDFYELGYLILTPITLRVETPKNNQSKNIRLLSDFRRVP